MINEVLIKIFHDVCLHLNSTVKIVYHIRFKNR